MSLKRKRKHNYEKVIGKLIKSGVLPSGAGVTDVYILHDEWCGIYKSKRCNCKPDVQIKKEG